MPIDGAVRNPVRSDPVRVAVVGCGAIARDFHLPVLAGHDGVRLTALVDRDIGRAAELARAYGVETVLADAAELDRKVADAALVATPPAHHAPCAIALAGRGLHLLVEKPMALSAAEATAMVDAAAEAGVVLAVGLFRRLFPSTRLLRGLVESHHLGRPVGFDIEAGSPYGWPLTTLANMRKDLGGGGVLIDIAPHVLDQILYVLPGAAELIDYRDNARGGVETDCLMRLRVHLANDDVVEGQVELSRTRKLRNTIRVRCLRGSYELPSGERFHVGIRPCGLELADDSCGGPRPYRLQAGWSDEPDRPGFAAYRAQIDDWMGAIRTGRPPRLSGESALPTVAVIEECYRAARRLPEPWVEEGLRPRTPATNGAPTALPAIPRRAARGRVLVTGATGFIGCRAAEMLALRDGWDVRGLVRDPAKASRLARLPVEMILGDLRRPDDVHRAVHGCEAVVHCAIGTAYGNRREIFEVTVEGTRRLAEAARTTGVARFVHVSTVAVHGKDVTGTLDESTPVRPPRGDDYAESKAAAEKVIERAASDGLSMVTLRLANVYGPYGATLTMRPIEHLARGALAIVGGDVKPSNMVFVDNVAQAVAAALDAPAEAAGQTFAISDGDGMTYADFYGYFARELGVAPPYVLFAPPPGPAVRRGGPLGWAPAWFRAWRNLLTSSELKALAKRYLNAAPVGGLPRRLLEVPAVDRRIRRLLKMDRPLVYRPEPAADAGRMVMNPSAAFVSPAKARRVLGFAPAVPTPRAMDLTLEWLVYARLATRRTAAPRASSPAASRSLLIGPALPGTATDSTADRPALIDS